MKKVAVTGCLSTGKTTACQFFKDLGAYVLSADEVVHQLLSPESPAANHICKLFDQSIITQGQIDREKLAAIAFSDPKKLKQLEAILHPLVFKEIETHYTKACKESSYSLFVVEVPLLFEAEWENAFDVIITVSSTQENARKRFASKFPQRLDEFEQRQKQQLPLQVKQQRADFVLQNDTTLEDLKNQVKKLYHHLYFS